MPYNPGISLLDRYPREKSQMCARGSVDSINSLYWENQNAHQQEEGQIKLDWINSYNAKVYHNENKPYL